LRKRYGADYQVITARSVKAALEVLGRLRDTGRQVSLVFADQWLPGATGTELLLQDGRPDQEWPLRRMPMFLESSLPGIFAVGDVLYGSVKRVAAAVGEGSTAIRLVHDHLRAE
jgi:hypothetical protein